MSSPLWSVARIVGSALVSVIVLAAIAVAAGWRVNLTTSMALGVYAPIGTSFAEGAIVAGCLPPTRVAEGVVLGYLPSGPCPGGGAPVVKRIVALGPSVVQVTLFGVFADNRRVGDPPRIRDHSGRVMHPIRSVALSVGSAFLLGDSPDSWDSRYFGAVSLAGFRAQRVIFEF